jgi:hypothetical protein
MEKFTLQNLSAQEKNIAIQRLTAVWAFVECGIGGLMHSLKFPFTGLIVGGFAILVITLIAKISSNHLSEIFKSLAIVLIVKLSLSPQTPFTAYIAVVFQATIAYWIYFLGGVTNFSIVFLSTICMLESALQKLIVLTIFFGQDLWTAIDKFITAIAPNVHFLNNNASFYIVATYLFIYCFGGVLIGYIISKTFSNNEIEYNKEISSTITIKNYEQVRQSKYKKVVWALIYMLIVCCYIYFYNTKNTFTAILKYVFFTTTIIWFWFYICSPLALKIINKLLQSKKQKYQNQLNQIFDLLPHLKVLFIIVWKESKQFKGSKRVLFFTKNIIIHSIIFNPSKNEFGNL